MQNVILFFRRYFAVLVGVLAAFSTLAVDAGQAAEPDTVRQQEISRQMNCVESLMGKSDDVSWQDVCFFSEEESNSPENAWEETSDQSSDRDHRDFMIFKRRHAVDRALTEWEKATKNHHEMAREKDWSQASEQHFAMEDVIETKEPIVSEKFARENMMPTSVQKHTFAVGSEFFYAKYVEPDVMNQRGILWGASGVYTYRPNQTDPFYLHALNMYQLEGMVAAGKFNYEAEAASQAGLQVKDKDDFMYELRGILGREYVDGKKILGLYSGLGYRYLNDDDNGELHFLGSTGIYGYERESNYFYIPLGGALTVPLDRKNTVTFKGEYDVLLFGWQVSHLSDGNPYLSLPNEDVTNDQKHGFGFRGSLLYTYQAERWTFLVEPFFRFWSIEDSEVVRAFVNGGYSSVLEPENKTFESGFRMGVVF